MPVSKVTRLTGNPMVKPGRVSKDKTGGLPFAEALFRVQSGEALGLREMDWPEGTWVQVQDDARRGKRLVKHKLGPERFQPVTDERGRPTGEQVPLGRGERLGDWEIPRDVLRLEDWELVPLPGSGQPEKKRAGSKQSKVSTKALQNRKTPDDA